MSDKKKKIESEVSENAAEMTEKITADVAETAAGTAEKAEAQASDASEIAAEAVKNAGAELSEAAPKKKKKEKTSVPETAEEKAARKLQKKFDRVDKKFSWRTVLKIVIPIVIIILFVFIFVKAAFGNSKNIKFDTSSFSKSDASPVDKSKGINGQLLSDAGMTIFADNGKLRLGYSPRDDLFIIQDLSTGRVFRSYPEPIYDGTVDANGNEVASDLAIYKSSTETGQILTSPVFIEYTKSGLEGGFTKGINQMASLTKTVYFINNGVQLIYDVGDLDLCFTVEITIEDNALVYRIPFNEIKERETLPWEEEDRRPFLCALSVLPYLGAHRDGETGYFVTPDGSGALTYFDVARVSNYNEYSKKVYGIDPTFDILDSPDYSNEKLTMGAYGIVDKDYMITSFIETGETNAELKIGNPGVKSLPFYSIYFEFTYRYFYRQQLTKGGQQYDMVIKDQQICDAEQRLYFDSKPGFVPGENNESAFTYVDVALKTKDLIMAKWNKNWGVQKTALTQSEAPMNIRFFMGDETISGGLLHQMKVLTTFNDVKKIGNELEEAGLTDLRLTLLGWTDHGYFWNATKKNKVESDFGGKNGLKSLNKWAKEKDLTLALDNNLLYIYGNPASGATLRNSVVKKPNTFYLNYFSNTTSGRLRNEGYYMSPKYFNSSLLNKQIKNLQKYGTSEVVLQQLGDTLYTDYNEKNALTRTQSRDYYVKWLEKYREKFDHVSVYYGNDYAVAFADTIDGIPIDKSSRIIFDEQVPFIQIVYHGLVEYYTSPLNSQDRPSYSLLKAIEYGANVSYEVTENEINLLMYTNYRFLYKGQFSLLKDEIISSYKAVNEAVKPFSTQKIVNHYRVAPYVEVFCTEYDGGAKVYVNYTESGYRLPDGNTVDSMSYLVVNA